MGEKIIVIGAGVGGLSIGAALLSRGFEVVILEKNQKVGGRAGGHREGDYIWPNGATAVIEPRWYQQPFVDAGEDWQAYFQLKFVQSPFCWSGKKTQWHWGCDMTDTLEALIRERGGRKSDDYLDYLADAKGRCDLSEQYRYYGKRHDGAGAGRKWLKRYHFDRNLRQWLTFMAAYPGGEPNGISVERAMQPALMQLEGIWQVEGGMVAYVEALERLVTHLGGEIYTQEAVEEIIVVGAKAVGVKTAKRLLWADGVVCAVDYHYARRALLPKETVDPYQRTDEDFKHSCGVFALYLLVEGEGEGAVHNMVANQALIGRVQGAYRGKILRRPPLYLYRWASADMVQMCVYCRVPNNLERPRRWHSKEKAQMVKRIMATLEHSQDFKGVGERVRAMGCKTPIDFSGGYFASGGAAFGIADEVLSRVDSLESMYFVGDSVCGGAGIHRVLAHSLLTAEQMAVCAVKNSTFLDTDGVL